MVSAAALALALTLALGTAHGAAQPGSFYGPIAEGETLWGIANALRARNGIIVQQSMVAIYDANRAAFDGNMFQIKQGATLKVPSHDAMRRIPREIARQEAERQRLLEQSGRRDRRAPHSLATLPRADEPPSAAEPAGPAERVDARALAGPEAFGDDSPLPPLTAQRLLAPAPEEPGIEPPLAAGPALADMVPRSGSGVGMLRAVRDGASDLWAWFAGWFSGAGARSAAAEADARIAADWRRVAREPEVLLGALAVIVAVTLLGLLAAPPRRHVFSAPSAADSFDERGGADAAVAEAPEPRFKDPPDGPAPAADEREPSADAYWNGDSVPASWRLGADADSAADPDSARRQRVIDLQLELADAYFETGSAQRARALLDEAAEDPALSQGQRARIARMLAGRRAE